MIVLGIETSCDETGCGLVNSEYQVLGQALYTQTLQHARFGGVVPEVAARAHLEKIGPLVALALENSGLSWSAIDVIAYTRGPGLLGPLLVGSSFAQGLAQTLRKPAMGLNHLEGHLASAYLSHPNLNPPFLALLVSGGHTELVRVTKGLKVEILGRTRDDAAGEAFDKTGKILGLGYPAGPEVAAQAAKGNRNQYRFPRALMEKGSLEFSFSGLKSAVLREVQKCSPEAIETQRIHLCASLETAIVDVLVAKVLWALDQTGENCLLIAGGVAANAYLRERLQQIAAKEGFRLICPEIKYCGDNGVMMAAAAQKRLQIGNLPEFAGVQPNLSWE